MINARRPHIYLAGLVLLATAVLLGSVARSTPEASAGGTTVQAGAAVVGVDQVAAVPLEALGVPAPGAGAWLIDVMYDTDLLIATNCTVPQTTAVCNPNFAVDTVRVAGIDKSGIEGDFELATMHFQCAGVGASPLTVSVFRFADAEFNDIPVAVVNGSITCSTELVGDTSCDSMVNSIDALLILQLTAALLGDLPCPNGDVNGDKIVNPIDATLVLQYAAGLLPGLPPP